MSMIDASSSAGATGSAPAEGAAHAPAEGAAHAPAKGAAHAPAEDALREPAGDPSSAPPAAPRKQITVAAAVVFRAGRVLLTQRKSGSHLAGAWELPGGKVELDEDPRDTVVRELREEIGVELAVTDILDVTFHRYPEKSVLLLFYEATLSPGSPEPTAIDVAAIRWARAEELHDESFPPADVAILNKVRARLR